MTRILHLSDLHFGLHRPELVDPLVQAVNDCAADLIVVTGDLAHRGRQSQFRQARAFLDRMNAPWLAMPGNHDLPVSPFRRLFRPLQRYRTFIATDAEPDRRVGRVRVIALDSADPFSWQRGRLSPGKAGAVAGSLSAADVNIIAIHHPFQHLPGVDKSLMRGAPAALAMLKEGGAHIILSGHLHRWSAGAFLDAETDRRVLEIQAGTALCARPSDRQNEFAVLDIEDTELCIRRHVAIMPGCMFETLPELHFSRASGSWEKVGANPDQAARPLIAGA